MGRAVLSVMEVIISLKRVPLFKDVPGEGLKRLSDFVREKHVGEGDLVFSRGDLGEEMYLVHDGAIRIYIEIEEKEVVLDTMQAGGYFGEMAIIDDLPRSASARALRGRVLKLHRVRHVALGISDHAPA